MPRNKLAAVTMHNLTKKGIHHETNSSSADLIPGDSCTDGSSTNQLSTTYGRSYSDRPNQSATSSDYGYTHQTKYTSSDGTS